MPDVYKLGKTSVLPGLKSVSTSTCQNRHPMRLKAIIVTVLLLIGLGFVPFQVIRGVGSAELTVNVTSISGRSIKAVMAESQDGVDNGQEFLDFVKRPDYWNKYSLRPVIQNPFLGAPLRVNVKTTSKETSALFWSRTHHYQSNGLIVVVEYSDGTFESRAVEVPNVRVNKNITVEVP